MQILKSKDLASEKVTGLIYSPPGMGKTTLLGMLPGKTLIVDIDRGTSVLRDNPNVDVVRLSEDLKGIDAIIAELQSKCEYDNVCLDSLSEFERAMLAYFGRIGRNDGVPDQASYLRVDYKLVDCCRQLRALPCNVFFTAWETQKEITATSGEKYTQARPMLRDKNTDNVCGLCDLVGRIVANKEGERFLMLEGNMNAIAKDRLFKRKFCKFEEVIK